MKKKIIIALIVIVVLAIIVIANLKSGQAATEVQTEKAFRADITQTVTGNGKIYPVTEVNISARVAGEILEIHADEGDSVVAGQVLVRLDSRQYAAAVERQKSSILGALADVKLKRSELNRAKELFDQNLISRAELEVAEAQYERALSILQQAEAALKEAEDALDKSVLKAPMTGVVIAKNKEVGEIALGSQFQEDVILTIADLSEMEARIEVNENDIINVSLGDSARVEIDAFPDTTFRAVVSKISHSARTKAQGTIEEVTNYDVYVRLLDKLPSFRPGMSATADIATQTKKDVINIPIQSLTARERKTLQRAKGIEKTPAERESEELENDPRLKKTKKEDELVEVVFVVKDGVVEMRPVKVGISDDNYYEVIEGLSEGEEVVTGPFNTLTRVLKNGDPVKVNNKKERFARVKEE
ncbi:MAG: efflux RND transporter periplasmic adaptor subunit [Calditrichia bacterium]